MFSDPAIELNTLKKLDENSFFYMPEYNFIARVYWTKLCTLHPTYLKDLISYDKDEGISYYDP